MSKDMMGDRMKKYEDLECGRRFIPLLPVIIRLDGVGFSKFTKGLRRPYDERLSNLMIETTRYLVELTNARCGYTQSDEITIGLFSDEYNSQIYFDGRIQKIVSCLAGKAAVYFNRQIPKFIPEKSGEFPIFDCRAYNMPNLEEATNAFLWREFDATKNSVSMAAREYFTHKELQNKHRKEMVEMLYEKNVNWQDYPTFFKRGTYFQKISNFSKQPETNEIVCKREIVKVEIPPLVKVTNRVQFLWYGKPPNVSNIGGVV